VRHRLPLKPELDLPTGIALKEIQMNTVKLSALLVAATLSVGALSQAAQAQGKTREQVRQELAQARHDGVIPLSKTKYPPTPDQIARNKEVHAAAMHRGEGSPTADHHDSIAAR